MGKLDNKIAIVTGAGQGIGKAIATKLAAEGATVVVTDVNESTAKETADLLGGESVGIRTDVTDRDSVNAMVEQVRRRFGRIDVLVNNAGINPAHLTPSDMTLEFWRKVFSVNLEGPLRMAQQVAPIMRDGGGGSIVNIGTMAAYGPGPGICAYGASKAGLLNLTKAMAMDWARWNIRVNLLSPGPFTSEMLLGAAAQDAGYLDMVANGTYLKRVADPSEIVGPVLYLASDASSFVTGDDLSVSGGMMK